MQGSWIKTDIDFGVPCVTMQLRHFEWEFMVFHPSLLKLKFGEFRREKLVKCINCGGVISADGQGWMDHRGEVCSEACLRKPGDDLGIPRDVNRFWRE